MLTPILKRKYYKANTKIGNSLDQGSNLAKYIYIQGHRNVRHLYAIRLTFRVHAVSAQRGRQQHYTITRRLNLNNFIQIYDIKNKFPVQRANCPHAS